MALRVPLPRIVPLLPGAIMQTKNHWEQLFSSKAADTVGWFQKHAELSLKFIRSTGIPHTASIIDVGGGASTLVDDLLADGYSNLTVLDISATALAATRRRLGPGADGISWIEADITKAILPCHAFDVWHDRAVFHFLTTPEDRLAYRNAALQSIKPGGQAIVATFAEDGPTTCSGLPVMRYRPEDLQAQFGPAFSLLRHENEAHVTPSGSVQKYLYCCFRKAG